MKTKVVSFRLPTTDYALLLLEAATNNVDLSDYVISKVYETKKTAELSTAISAPDYKAKYKQLLYALVDAIDTNNVFGVENQFGEGKRIIVMNTKQVQEIRNELEGLK
jgi:hypothetical protein